MIEKIVVTKAELKSIEDAAARYPSKDGLITPRVIRCFIKFMETTYGIDLGIETEEMYEEREKHAKKDTFRLLRKLGRNTKLDGKPSNDSDDDF